MTEYQGPVPVERAELGRYVQAPVDDLKLRRQWRSIAQRVGNGQTRTDSGWGRSMRWMLAGAGVAAVAAALMLFGPNRDDSPARLAQAVLETKNDSTQVSLADGSVIELLPQSRLEMIREEKNAVHLVLGRGEARFDVTHVEGRRFDVVAENVRVHVVGTAFAVGLDDEVVKVRVERGTVEVSVDGKSPAVRLDAGQSWSVERLTPPASTTAKSAPSVEEGTEDPADAPLLPTDDAERPTEATSAQLFQKANQLRSQANFAGAASSYRELLTRFPADPRTGLVAYELARLQMDRLGDYAGATKNLTRALRASTGGSFREGAMARLVETYEATGSVKQCSAARDAYLRQYPAGAYQKRVAQRCQAAREEAKKETTPSAPAHTGTPGR